MQPDSFQQKYLSELAKGIGAFLRACALPQDSCAQEPGVAPINYVVFSSLA